MTSTNTTEAIVKSNHLKYLVSGFLLLLILQIGKLSAQDQPKTNPDPARFQKEIDNFVTWDRKNATPQNPVLFVGSSSIRLWQSAEAFPALPVVNRGFGGAHISDMLFHFDKVISKYHPQIIVFYCGDNDVAYGKTVDQVVADFDQLVSRCPAGVKFVYLPIKPSTSRLKFWPQMNRVNQIIREKCEKQESLFYADTASPLMDATGKPRAELLLADGLHLNSDGYAVWNAVLQPLLTELVGH